MGLASLELSQVLYDDSSYFSLALALITLSPILLMPSYAALAIVTREVTIINMWVGQFCCEGFNLVVKRMVKQGRPPGSVANGYGFPSSHSQYMGYFATFLILHLHFKHKFGSRGSSEAAAFRVAIYTAIITWAGVVAYSRYHLSYHSVSQIFWGVGIGVSFGGSFYLVAELIPALRPNSLLGKVRTYIFRNPISQYLRIRDGWAVWQDGGVDDQWRLWNQLWKKQRTKSAYYSR